MSIKIITEPKVYLVGSTYQRRGLPDFLDDQGVPDWQTDAPSSGEILIETGGRLCYESFANPRPGGNKAYIDHILESGHGSVLEHAVFTLILTGISRSCSHELVRHRHLSPSQLSQRYVDESDVAFVVPPLILRGKRGYQASQGELLGDDTEYASWQAYHLWYGSCQTAVEAYRSLADKLDCQLTDIPDKTLRRKQAREAARSVLPNCTETKIQLTGNARAWRNYLDQRATPHADAEMRRLALAIHRVLVAESPNLFGDYTPVDDCLVTPYRKV